MRHVSGSKTVMARNALHSRTLEETSIARRGDSLNEREFSGQRVVEKTGLFQTAVEEVFKWYGSPKANLMQSAKKMKTSFPETMN